MLLCIVERKNSTTEMTFNAFDVFLPQMKNDTQQAIINNSINSGCIKRRDILLW